jgi:hypothetical protein
LVFWNPSPGVAAGLEVGVGRPRGDPVHLHRLAALVRIGLVSREAVERLSAGRDIAGVRVQEPQHVIEGAVLQHQLDHGLHLTQLIGHGALSLTRTFRSA